MNIGMMCGLPGALLAFAFLVACPDPQASRVVLASEEGGIPRLESPPWDLTQAALEEQAVKYFQERVQTDLSQLYWDIIPEDGEEFDAKETIREARAELLVKSKKLQAVLAFLRSDEFLRELKPQAEASTK